MPPTTDAEPMESSVTLRAAAAPVNTTSLTMWWAVFGVALLFGSAALRLGGRGVTTLLGGIEPVQWLVVGALTVAFVYGEGVLALQRSYVPRVIRRVELLRDEPRRWYRLLAPLHALTLIGAAPLQLARAWGGLALIVTAVLIVRRFPEPWRGIVGFAVAAALAWGTYALLRAARRAFR
jgi:hypothetical protein